MLSMFITIMDIDGSGKHMYTKAREKRRYVESAYQGFNNMTCDLSKYKEK